MIIHIVHANENIHLIADQYHVGINDIMSINKHITDFYHLQVGAKIKIPLIGEDVMEELEETEPFIEDYYPQETEGVKEKKAEEKINEQEDFLEEEEAHIDKPLTEKKQEKKIKYPYYYYYNNYYKRNNKK